MSVIAQRDGVRVATFQKCGHTSIINMFMTPPGQPIERGAKPAVLVSGPDHPPPAKVYKGFSDAVGDWPTAKVTIAVLRNPLDRAASAYQHFIVRTLSIVDGLRTLGRETFTELGFDADMTFPDFLQHLHKIDLNYDNHLKPQAVSLNEAASGLVHCVQLEQIAAQWPLIVDAFGLPCTTEVADFNAANYTYDSDHWSTAFAKELYADDYKLWEQAHVETREALPPISRQAP